MHIQHMVWARLMAQKVRLGGSASRLVTQS
jgi:hypothetical protein